MVKDRPTNRDFRELVAESGMDRDQLSEVLGLDRKTVYRYLTDINLPSARRVPHPVYRLLWLYLHAKKNGVSVGFPK